MKTFVQIGNGEQSALPPEEKEELLLSRLAGIPSLIVALSGGADSAYLAWASNRALGERALSVTALSPSFSAYDREMVEQFAKQDRKSTRLNSSHVAISYAVFCLKKKKNISR